MGAVALAESDNDGDDGIEIPLPRFSLLLRSHTVAVVAPYHGRRGEHGGPSLVERNAAGRRHRRAAGGGGHRGGATGIGQRWGARRAAVEGGVATLLFRGGQTKPLHYFF
jgi:hypothetical protein